MAGPAAGACPICGSGLRSRGVEGYVCDDGHRVPLALAEQLSTENAVRALWSAVRALENSAELCRRLAARHSETFAGEQMANLAARHDDEARQVRELISRLTPPP
jgi:two-component system chemotaxis response regulator CheB